MSETEYERIQRALRKILNDAGLRNGSPNIGIISDEGEDVIESGTQGVFIRAQGSGEFVPGRAGETAAKLQRIAHQLREEYDWPTEPIVGIIPVYTDREVEKLGERQSDPPLNALIVDKQISVNLNIWPNWSGSQKTVKLANYLHYLCN